MNFGIIDDKEIQKQIEKTDKTDDPVVIKITPYAIDWNKRQTLNEVEIEL